MLSHELLPDEGILIVRPEGALEESDFESLSRVVDRYIEKNGHLQGLMIEAESFPGWSDFGALISHLRFIHDHHTTIEKVAAVSDNAFLAIAPSIATHFVDAELRHFDFKDRQEALAWLRKP